MGALGSTPNPSSYPSITPRDHHKSAWKLTTDMSEFTEHGKAIVILFKDSGKYYTQEEWEVPPNAIGPYDMERSSDFRRIGNGKVLVTSQEPWGYPHLL